MISRVIFLITLYFVSCFCQFSMDFGMRPDVTFGDENERFDVAPILKEQSRLQNALRDDDFRRYLKTRIQNQNEGNSYNTRRYDIDNKDKENEEMMTINENNDNREKHVDTPDTVKDTVDLPTNNYAHHEKETSPDDEDYEKNLKPFDEKQKALQDLVNYLHGGHKSGRRGVPPDPEAEILFHHGVPINMKIDGYLQVPLETN